MKKLVMGSAVIGWCVVCFFLVSCDTGVANMGKVDQTGKNFSFDKGVSLSFQQLSDYERAVTENGEPGYMDVNGAVNPINEQGLVTCKRDPDNPDHYSPGANPIVFDILQAPNFLSQSFQAPGMALTYTAEFRLTDNTKTTVEQEGASLPEQTADEPQGFIMAELFLSGSDPNGALMLMIFPEGAFPHDDVKYIVDLGNPELDENVFLVMNYDSNTPDASGSIIAMADYPGIKVDETPEVEDDSFNTATLRIHNDAGYTEDGVFHGPTVSVIINGDEVIRYQNDGASHSHGNTGWSCWDSVGSVTGQGDLWIAKDVLQIADGDDPDPQYFDDNTGVDAWNDAWKTMIYRASGMYAAEGEPAGPITDKIGFGATFQIGKNEDNAGYSRSRSPEIRNISVSKK